MGQSKITIHHDENITELLAKLPDTVQETITRQLAEEAQRNVYVGVVGKSLSRKFKFVEGLFQTVSLVTSPSMAVNKLHALANENVACYYANHPSELVGDTELDATFYIIDIESGIDAEDLPILTTLTHPVIPVIVYTEDDYARLTSPAHDLDGVPVKNATLLIQETLRTFAEPFTVCASIPESMTGVSAKLVALLPNSRKALGGATIHYHALSHDTAYYAQKHYINVFAQALLPYYNTVTDDEKAQINALMEDHFSPYLTPPKEEEDTVSRMVSNATSAISNAATTAKTGIDSLFKSIKEKF